MEHPRIAREPRHGAHYRRRLHHQDTQPFRARRAGGPARRKISVGEPLTVERDNDKNTVVALREIAEETVDLDGLAQSLVRGLQKHVEADEPEEDDIALLMSSEEWVGVSEAAEPVEESAVAETEGEEVASPPGADESDGASDDAS